MDRCIGRMACYAVAFAFGTLLPTFAQSEEIRAVRPHAAPAVESVQPQAGLAGSAVAPVPSTCPPSYCGIIGQSVFVKWSYPECAILDCGTETWYVKNLPSSIKTYTISRKTTTGNQTTKITLKIRHNAPLGQSEIFTIGADCSGSDNIKCTPAYVDVVIDPARPVNFQQVGPAKRGPMAFYTSITNGSPIRVTLST